MTDSLLLSWSTVLLFITFCITIFIPYPSKAFHKVKVHSESNGLDEGMWTFDSPPLKLLFERYKFTPTKEWLDTLRLATVRFTTGGGSGAFVSTKGLVITNHHVVLEQLQRLSTKERDIIANGYAAGALTQELKCPEMELDILVGMENITGRMLRLVKKGITDEELFAVRQTEIRRIETEYSSEQTNTRAEVVTLYSGGEYWLYRYKRYTDVRLVAAPELQAANFGGDYDNFTYPRYALDFALVRVYEGGKPIQSPHFLKWKSKGYTSQEPVFVSGYPGSTNRLNTYTQFVFNRDVFYPFMLRRINSILMTARRYSERGTEQSRRALEDILNDENIKKSLVGEYKGLMDKKIELKCRQNENELRQKISSDRNLTNLYSNAWETVERVVEKQAVIFKEYTATFSTPLADIAFSIIRYALEKENIASLGAAADKSSEKKAPEKQSFLNADKALKKELLGELRAQSLSPAIIALDYEEIRLAGELEFLLSELSAGDPFVRTMLGEGSILRTPVDVARDAVRGTRLTDIAFRKTLLDGGRKAIDNSTDPMIVFMRKLVPLWLEREEYQRNNIQAPLSAALEKIALARFAVYGKSAYPDANFSLRLSVGTVQGYVMNGTLAPELTTLYGLFDRAAGFASSAVASDFAIPNHLAINRESIRDKMPLSTPVNFVTTCDIVGGNSGSPLVNRNLELVGLVFDGNIESLSGRFVYNEETGRTLCVHPTFIIEALRKLYNAGNIADELENVKQNSLPTETKPSEPNRPENSPEKTPEKNMGKANGIKRSGRMTRDHP
jgi:hypothetical protein